MINKDQQSRYPLVLQVGMSWLVEGKFGYCCRGGGWGGADDYLGFGDCVIEFYYGESNCGISEHRAWCCACDCTDDFV